MQLRGHRCRVVAGRRVQAGRRGRRGALGALEDQGLEVDPFLEAAADLQVELVNDFFLQRCHFNPESSRHGLTGGQL